MGTVSVLVLAGLIGVAVLLLRAGDGLRAPGPRLSPDLPAALLLRAGFPVTDHNVVAVGERLAARFLGEVAEASIELAAGVRSVAGGDPSGRAQRVLDAIAETDPSLAVRLAYRAPEELLATAGTGRGFFGGSVFEPLPLPALGAPAPVAATAIPVPRAPRVAQPVVPVAPAVVVAPVA